MLSVILSVEGRMPPIRVAGSLENYPTFLVNKGHQEDHFLNNIFLNKCSCPSVMLPPHPWAHRTLICQGGTRGELRQWSYAAGEVPSRSSGDDNTAGGADKCDGAGSARPSESARPAPVVRKLTHQVKKKKTISGGGWGMLVFPCGLWARRAV